MNQTTPTGMGQPAPAQDSFSEDQTQSRPDLAEIFALYTPDIHARLLSNPPARVADIGCGNGRSSVNMARAYPKVRVDGYDNDKASIRQAWANARQAGVTDRVTFHVRDVGDDTLNGRYDLIMALESIHDIANLESILKVMRRLAGRDGAVIILAEHRLADALEHYAKEAGFRHAAALPMDNARSQFYCLENAG